MDPANEPQHNGYESVTKRMTSNEIKLGNKLLVYISCCLAGRAYPYGDIPNDMIAKVKYDVYTCLTTIHTKRLDLVNAHFLDRILDSKKLATSNLVFQAFERFIGT